MMSLFVIVDRLKAAFEVEITCCLDTSMITWLLGPNNTRVQCPLVHMDSFHCLQPDLGPTGEKWQFDWMIWRLHCCITGGVVELMTRHSFTDKRWDESAFPVRGPTVASSFHFRNRSLTSQTSCSCFTESIVKIYALCRLRSKNSNFVCSHVEAAEMIPVCFKTKTPPHWGLGLNLALLRQSKQRRCLFIEKKNVCFCWSNTEH